MCGSGMTCWRRAFFFLPSFLVRFRFRVAFREKLNGFNELINVENDGLCWKSTFFGFSPCISGECKSRIRIWENDEVKTLCILSMLKCFPQHDQRHFEISVANYEPFRVILISMRLPSLWYKLFILIETSESEVFISQLFCGLATSQCSADFICIVISFNSRNYLIIKYSLFFYKVVINCEIFEKAPFHKCCDIWTRSG